MSEPDWLPAFISVVHIADLAIAVLVLETIFLAARARRRGESLPAGLMANAMSGICLLLALRAALGGAGIAMIGLWLACGFAAHLADIRVRFRPRD